MEEPKDERASVCHEEPEIERCSEAVSSQIAYCKCYQSLKATKNRKLSEIRNNQRLSFSKHRELLEFGSTCKTWDAFRVWKLPEFENAKGRDQATGRVLQKPNPGSPKIQDLLEVEICLILSQLHTYIFC
ncbi:hypothetical protein J6590_062285 [Homalodisca vitripennis]|nr:hypothetical protein J6590_062285 [Homalodisca vitripennis]